MIWFPFLDLERTSVSSAGLAHTKGMTNISSGLNHLDLVDINVSDVGLVNLNPALLTELGESCW